MKRFIWIRLKDLYVTQILQKMWHREILENIYNLGDGYSCFTCSKIKGYSLYFLKKILSWKNKIQ